MAFVLAIGALLGLLLPADALDWQSRLAWREPWRWWTAAFVHWSRWHLIANAAGLALVALLGSSATVPARCALAWTAAWPLTHGLLLLRPELAHFGGLSGVLHAGVGVAAWHLVRWHHGRTRAVGAALLAGIVLKVLLEAPWGPVLRQWSNWDIPIAPVSHATGLMAGLFCAWLLDRQRTR